MLAQEHLESPLALTPTDLELRAEPTVAISVHDKSRLQWTATVPLAGNDYELSVELEIPVQIDAPHAPWEQLQEYARLDEPRAGTRAQAALEALRSSTVSVALRLARASEGFSRHCELALRRAAEVDPCVLDTGLSVWPELARRAVAEARDEFLAPNDRCAPEIEAERAFAAEWISNEMVRFLTQASHSLMRVTARPIVETYPFSAIIRSAEEQIFQMLELESAWRRTHGVPAFDIVQVEQRAHNWAAALAALVASSWAFAWQLLLAHRTSALATAGSESFVQSRGSAPDPLGSPSGMPVSIVRFQQRGRPGRELPTIHATQVRIGFRYDLSPLFSRMHDLAKPVAVADAGTRRIRFLNSPRSYRVRVRVRLRCGGTVREETASLVMNKQGLQRLESAPIR